MQYLYQKRYYWLFFALIFCSAVTEVAELLQYITVSFFRSRFWTAVWNCNLHHRGLLRKLIPNVFIFKSNLFSSTLFQSSYELGAHFFLFAAQFWINEKFSNHLNLSSTLSLNFRGWVVQPSLFLKQKNVQFIPYS